MSDGEIKVGIRVDTSTLPAGMATNASAVEDFAARSAKAMEAYNAASARGKVAQEALGKAFDAASAAGADFTTAMERAVAATSQKEQVTRSATQAEQLFAASIEESAVAAGHQVSQMAAASGAIRVFEGNIPIRAVENFATKILGLGPLLQFAFPVVGAIALLEVVGHVVEKIDKTYEAAKNAGPQLEQAYRDATVALALHNDQLALTNDGLQATLDKLNGVRHNTLEDDLDRARLMADKLYESLQKDLVKANELIQKNKVTEVGSWMTGQATTKDASDTVRYWQDQIKKKQDEYKETFDGAIFNGATKDSLDKLEVDRLNALQQIYAKQDAALRDHLKKSRDMQAEFEAGGRLNGDLNQSANIALYGGALDLSQEQQRSVGEQYRNEHLKDQVDGAKSAKTPKPKKTKDDSGKEYEDDKREFETTARLRNDDVKEEYDFWQKKIEAAQNGTALYAKIWDRMERLADEGAAGKGTNKGNSLIGKQEKADKSQDFEGFKALEEGLKALRKMQEQEREDLDKTGPRWAAYHREVEKAATVHAQASAAMEQVSLTSRLQEGTISQLGYDHAEAAIKAREYAEELAALRKQLEAINKDDVLKPEQKQSQLAQVQNQISQVESKRDVAAAQGVGKVKSDQLAQLGIPNMKQLDQQFDNSIASWTRGTQNFSQAFGKMWADNATNMITHTSMMAIHWAAKHAEMFLTKTATDQAIVASTATAEAEKGGIEGLAMLKSISKSAVVAAGKAYSSVADIPVIGPVLGAAAAAGTFVAVEGLAALASFDVGTNFVPKDGLAMIHEGERIIPRADNSRLMDRLDNGGSGGSINMHYAPQISGIDGASVAGMAQQHGQVFMRQAAKMIRNMNR